MDKECSFSIAQRRQKPFYYVSEEEYRLLHQICKNCLPGQDLSVPNLRLLASRGGPQIVTSPTNGSKPTTPSEAAPDNPRRSREAGSASVEREDDVQLSEIVDLHEDLGCLLPDTDGEHRRTPIPSKSLANGIILTVVSFLVLKGTWGQSPE